MVELFHNYFGAIGWLIIISFFNKNHSPRDSIKNTEQRSCRLALTPQHQSSICWNWISVCSKLTWLFYSNVDRFQPKIHILNYKRVFVHKERDDISLFYNVSSHPVSNIYWWKSTDGVNYKLIARCLKSNQRCKDYEGKENITKTLFSIKDVQFPADNNVFYKLNAMNTKGNDSKAFQIQVLGKANYSYL